MERVVLVSLISLCSLGGVLAAFSNADVGTLGDPSFTSRSSGYGGVRYRGRFISGRWTSSSRRNEAGQFRGRGPAGVK